MPYVSAKLAKSVLETAERGITALIKKGTPGQVIVACTDQYGFTRFELSDAGQVTVSDITVHVIPAPDTKVADKKATKANGGKAPAYQAAVAKLEADRKARFAAAGKAAGKAKTPGKAK